MNQLNPNQDDTIPVPRRRIFVLNDGNFVVQWEEHRVQSLLSGRYFQYDEGHFGTAISDYELNQLKNSGIVYDYDQELVYLSPRPMVMPQAPTRSFYLNTRLNKSQRYNVEEAMRDADLNADYSVRVQEIFVIIRGPAGMPFRTFEDAERSREILMEKLPAIFNKLVVAFIEVNSTV